MRSFLDPPELMQFFFAVSSSAILVASYQTLVSGMQKQCIGCQREISWGQNECPFCGASQSRLKYYRPQLLILLLLIAAGLWGGRTVYQQALASAQQSMAEENQAIIQQNESQIQSLQTALAEKESELTTLQTELNQLKESQSSSASETQSQLKELRTQLTSAKAEVEKQQGRANWLGKENIRLKSEIDQLKLSLVEAEKQSTPVEAATQDDNIPPTQTTSTQDEQSDGL